MATIDTITASFPLRAAAIALLLCGACTAAEPDDADPSVVPHEVADRPVAASDALEDAVEAWHATCEGPGLDGLGVAPQLADAPLPCGPRLLGVALVARSPAAEDAGDVLDGLVGDIEQFTRGPFEPAQVGAMGNAALARLDAGIERFLGGSLDGKDRLREWLHDGEQMIIGLAAMKRFGSPEMNVRAALRTAIVYAGAHDKIGAAFESDLPEFCAAAAEYTDSLAAQALHGAQWCVDEAVRKDYDGPLVDRCRAMVAKLSGVPVAPTASADLRARE